MSAIHERIKETRKSLGFTQKKLGDALGISSAHVSSIEHGHDNPSSALIKLICMKFNISEEWLTEGIGSMRPSWDGQTDEGILTKYNDVRVSFERTLDSLAGDELINTVEAFAYLGSLLSPKELADCDKSNYLTSVCAVLDEFEKLVFMVSANRSLLPSKNDLKSWLNFRKECEDKIKVIDGHIKDAVNVYLALHGDEMKL